MKDPILLAGMVVAFGCLAARRSPASILMEASVLTRAAWLLAGEMAGGAWARRNRWRECVERSWRERV